MAGAQVLDHLIGLQDIGADLVAPADFGLGFIFARGFGFAALQFGFEQARFQHAHRGGAVLVLAAVILAGDDDAGGGVGDADGAVGGIDVLAAGAGGAIGVDLEVALVDLDLETVVDHRIDPDAGETGVALGGAVERGDADQPVDAALGLGIAIGILALDLDRRGFDTGLIACLIIDHRDLVSAGLGPALVHAQQHFGPVLALGAAGAGVDFDIGVETVGFAGEQGLDLVAVGAGGELFERGDAFVGQTSIAFFLGHLDKFERVVAFLLDFAGGADRFIEAAAFGHHCLGGCLVIPQGRVLDAGVELVKAPQGNIPVERGLDQGKSGVDPVDKGLRVGTHDILQNYWLLRLDDIGGK